MWPPEPSYPGVTLSSATPALPPAGSAGPCGQTESGRSSGLEVGMFVWVRRVSSEGMGQDTCSTFLMGVV